MKTLYLLRHAKSSWNNPNVPDRLRPLSGRGRRASALIGRYLQNSNDNIQSVVSSPARRAVDTANLVLDAIDGAPLLQQDESLYFGGWPAYLDVIHSLPDSVDRALLVGHDPDIHSLVLKLAGLGTDKALGALAEKFPTGALAVLEFAGSDWGDIVPGTGHLRAFIRPRDLSLQRFKA
ncbi:MAG: histidine phosphatase family protein [Rhodospirillaceae bacterium]